MLYIEDEGAPVPIKPKLTMKYLHLLIIDIQAENELLGRRITEMEQQLIESDRTGSEVAITKEQSHAQEEIIILGNHEQGIQLNGIQISRTIRHASPKKKSFWSWK